jgi:hypothetical protein
MAGVVPIVPPRTGSMAGKLEVETTRFITFDELCAHVPQVKSFLEELDKQGWKYLLIDAQGKVVMELTLAAAPYTWQSYEAPRGGFAYKLAFDFGRQLPRLALKRILGLDNCIINICSRDYARAVTVDLTKNEVTYVHDALWVSRGEGHVREAQGVLQILRWLVEEKHYKLAVSGGEGHYRELKAGLGGKS